MWRIITILSLIITFCLNRLQVIQAQETRLSGLVMSIEWSPDGSRLAVATSDGVWLFIQGELSELGSGYTNDISWSPNGNFLAVLRRIGGGYVPGDIEIWDVSNSNTPQLLRTFRDENLIGEDVEDLDWYPYDNIIAISGIGIRLWNADTGTLMQIIQPDAYSYSLQWSPDSTTLMSITGSGVPKLWDGETGNLIRALDFPTSAYDITWGNDSNHVAVNTSYTEVSLIDLSNSDSEPILLSHSYGTGLIDWQGNTLASAVDEGIQVWDVSTQQPVTLITDLEGLNFELSPDGLQIAYMREGEIVIEALPIPPSIPAIQARLRGCILPEDQEILTSLNAKIDSEEWQAFINEVEAQRGNKVSEDCANDLIEMAQYLMENQ